MSFLIVKSREKLVPGLGTGVAVYVIVVANAGLQVPITRDTMIAREHFNILSLLNADPNSMVMVKNPSLEFHMFRYDGEIKNYHAN